MPYDAAHPPPRGFLYLLAWILAWILRPTGRRRANERIRALADFAEQSRVPGKISTIEYRKNKLAVEILFNPDAQSDDDDKVCLVLAMTSTWAAMFSADDEPVELVTLGDLSMTPAEVFAAVEMASPFKYSATTSHKPPIAYPPLVGNGVCMVTTGDVQSLLAEYRGIAETWAETPVGDHRKANRLFDNMHVLAKQLRASDEGRAALLTLLRHENAGVRTSAGAECLPFDPGAAMPVLEDVERSSGAHSLAAKYTLIEFRKGSLNMDW